MEEFRARSYAANVFLAIIGCPVEHTDVWLIRALRGVRRVLTAFLNVFVLYNQRLQNYLFNIRIALAGGAIILSGHKIAEINTVFESFDRECARRLFDHEVTSHKSRLKLLSRDSCVDFDALTDHFITLYQKTNDLRSQFEHAIRLSEHKGRQVGGELIAAE